MINEIKQKLRKFIIKYHLNQMIRGSIFALTGLLAMYLIMVTAEHFGYFSTMVRKILIITYMAFAAFIIYRFVIKALLKIYGVYKPMSNVDASKYIGKYLPEVSDKLLNLIQLQDLHNSRNKQFLEKALDQKARELRPFNFPEIIDLKVNRKYLKFLAIPLGVFIVIVLMAPGFITEPTKRIATYNTDYERPQPFYIHLMNEKLNVVEGDNVELKFRTTGEKNPGKLYYIAGNERRILKQNEVGKYFLKLKNIRNEKKFHITDGIVKSKDFKINVFRKPEIIGYKIKLDYPVYTGKKDEIVENNGDLIVPHGTRVEWEYKTRNTNTVKVLFGKQDTALLEKNFNVSRKIMNDFQYSIITSNDNVVSSDTMRYNVSVVPDKYPEIKLNLVDDSSASSHTFFSGIIGDDYGFTSLKFYWKIGEQGKFKSKSLNIEGDVRKQVFYHSFNKDTLIGPGEEMKYYFKVWDNDAVSGPKASKTNTGIIREPSEEELEKDIEEKNKNIKKTLEEASDELNKMNKKFEEMRKKLINKKKLDWQDKENIKNLLKKSQNLKKRVEKLKEELKNKNKKEDKLTPKDEQLLEKEKKLQELMDKVLDEELLKKLEELRKMLDKEDKDKLQQSMEKLNQENMDLEKELERNLELFKRLEVEKEISEAAQKLKKLEKEQQKAIDQKNKDSKLDKQKEINKEFEKIKEKLDDAGKKNEKLEEPFELKNTKPGQKDIQKQLNNAMENLKQGKNRKGKQSQQKAGEEMNKLSEQLQQMMMEMQQKATGEDMRAIRTLLENTIKISLEQEELMNQFESISKDDPKFIDLVQEQKDLKEDLQKVKDSLYALSKRQIMIKSFVNKELSDIDRNMDASLESMLALNTIGRTRKRDKDEAIKRQQYVMKGMNNIALMLSESLDQMKQQMRSMSKKMSNKNCKNPKPGKGKPSLKQMQQQMNNMLDKMKQQMKEGKRPGKSGKKMSEEFARAAAKQREIRKRLEELRKKMQSQGNNEAGESIGETLEKMDKTEEELVNKILNQNTIKRQQDILTRLLEHEKAQREQEFEKKRESEEAKDKQKSNPEEFLKYKRIKEQETELLRMVPPELLPFYKKKMNEYYINLGR